MVPSSNNNFEGVDDESFDQYFDQHFEQTFENLAENYGDQQEERKRRKKRIHIERNREEDVWEKSMNFMQQEVTKWRKIKHKNLPKRSDMLWKGDMRKDSVRRLPGSRLEDFLVVVWKSSSPEILWIWKAFK